MKIGFLTTMEDSTVGYRYSGRDYRLTDVSGRVIRDIIA